MPIRPENRDRYPADWPELALKLKEEAGWQCECAGQCGRPHHRGEHRCDERHGQPSVHGGRCHTIVLTVAHLDHTPENNLRSNLLVMCQGCHLHYDIDHHRQSRVRCVHAAREAAGQLALSV